MEHQDQCACAGPWVTRFHPVEVNEITIRQLHSFPAQRYPATVAEEPRGECLGMRTR